MNFKECCIRRNELISQFKRIFHINPVWDLGFLFDISSLEKDLKVPDGVSTTDFIKENYGDEANKVVDEMIELATDFAETMNASTDGEYRESQNKGLLGIARRLNGSIK